MSFMSAQAIGAWQPVNNAAIKSPHHTKEVCQPQVLITTPQAQDATAFATSFFTRRAAPQVKKSTVTHLVSFN
jgi:hypothetical protein